MRNQPRPISDADTMMKRSLLMFALSLWALGAQAEVYKWIDADGKVQYGDAPPKNVKAKVVSGGVTVVPATVVPPPPAPKAKPEDQPGNAAAQAGAAAGAADRKPDNNAPPASPPPDPAIAARKEARIKAIERCKANRGTDCDNEADAQYSGEQPAVVYSPGVIPGWSQPPIRPANRPLPPDATTKPHPRPPSGGQSSSVPTMGRNESQSSAIIKPMR